MSDEPIDELEAANRAYAACPWWRPIKRALLALRVERALSDVRADEMARIERAARGR